MAQLQQTQLEPGDVVAYTFMWSTNWMSGHVLRPRPCVVLHAADLGTGQREAVLLPITHTPQNDPRNAIAVPREMSLLMGLDDRANFVVINEANSLLWTGNSRLLMGKTPSSFHRTLQFAVGHAQARGVFQLTEINQVRRRPSIARGR